LVHIGPLARNVAERPLAWQTWRRPAIAHPLSLPRDKHVGDARLSPPPVGGGGVGALGVAVGRDRSSAQNQPPPLFFFFFFFSKIAYSPRGSVISPVDSRVACRPSRTRRRRSPLTANVSPTKFPHQAPPPPTPPTPRTRAEPHHTKPPFPRRTSGCATISVLGWSLWGGGGASGRSAEHFFFFFLQKAEACEPACAPPTASRRTFRAKCSKSARPHFRRGARSSDYGGVFVWLWGWCVLVRTQSMLALEDVFPPLVATDTPSMSAGGGWVDPPLWAVAAVAQSERRQYAWSPADNGERSIAIWLVHDLSDPIFPASRRFPSWATPPLPTTPPPPRPSPPTPHHPPASPPPPPPRVPEGWDSVVCFLFGGGA